MAVSRSHGRQRGLFLFGVSLVGVGGWLLVRLAMLVVGGLLGQNGLGGNAATLWRIAGGVTLVAIGFTAMAYSSAAAENWAVDFETGHAPQATETETRPTFLQQANRIYGPPRPHIVIRCSNCRTLNEQSHAACIHCGGVL